jgi:penicillin-binding protein 1C
MTTSSAALLLDILSDPVARMPGFGNETPLDFPFRTATKTGTSRHYTDNWAIATTARFTVAVWVGNFSGRPMQKVSGITGAGPLLHRAVLETAKRYAPGTLVDPERAGLTPAPVCILSGMLASRECPSMIEWFAPGTEPRERDTWQISGNERREQLAMQSDVSPASQPEARILSPMDGDRYQRSPSVDPRYQTIPLLATNAQKVRWSIDGKPLFNNRWRIVKGTHVIAAHWPTGARDSVIVVVE